MVDDPLTISRFEEQIGAIFDVIDEQLPSLELELASVTALGSVDAEPRRRTPFSLIFHGELEPVLPQRIYRLENQELGTHEIFLVPIGPAGDAMQYEAIFT